MRIAVASFYFIVKFTYSSTVSCMATYLTSVSYSNTFNSSMVATLDLFYDLILIIQNHKNLHIHYVYSLDIVHHDHDVAVVLASFIHPLELYEVLEDVELILRPLEKLYGSLGPFYGLLVELDLV